MRAITGDYSCALCRQEMTCVICTVKDAPFRTFQVPGNPSPDLFYHSKSRMFIPKNHFTNVIAPLFEYKCKHCHMIFEEGDLLRSHYESRHGLTLCTLCLHHKQAFPSEQTVYTVADYDKVPSLLCHPLLSSPHYHSRIDPSSLNFSLLTHTLPKTTSCSRTILN